MMFAHIVPGYFAAAVSDRPRYWTPLERAGLWGTAVVSCILPDIDVIYNIVVRGYANHAVLITHSIFPYLALGSVWLFLVLINRLPYIRLLFGLVAFGGLSHIALDVIAHSTPLFYPFSTRMIGNPPDSIFYGGVPVYLRHPLFLIEPFLLMLMVCHWIFTRDLAPCIKWRLEGFVVGSWFGLTLGYVLWLYNFQSLAASLYYRFLA